MATRPDTPHLEKLLRKALDSARIARASLDADVNDDVFDAVVRTHTRLDIYFELSGRNKDEAA